MPNWKKVIVSGSNASLNTLNVTAQFTASGLHYPTADGGEFSFVQSDGNGNLSLQLVNTINDTIYNGEATTILRGTPVYVSGSVGANPKVFRADAAIPAKMPVTYIVGDDIPTATTGRGIILGQIDAVNTTGYPEGSEIYVAPGGGWTSARPTGSAEVQVLGIVTKEGSGGKGLVLNPGPVLLPNLNSGSIWVGNSNSVPTAIATSSIQNVISASFATQALSASYAPSTPAFPYTGSAEITGSLGVTGSFNVLDSIDATNKILIGSGPIPGSTEDSVNWDSRTLLDSNGNFSVRWGALRTMFDASQVDSISWDARILKDALGNDSGQWGMRRLISTNTSRSIDWENRSLHDFSGNITVEWTSTALYDVSAKNALNWDARDAYDSAEIPAINWDARRLIDSSAVAAVRWDLRSAYDTVDSQSIDWGSRLLKIDNEPGAYTVNWNAGILRDTNSKNSVDWQNRILIDASDVTTVDWKNAKLNANTTSPSVNWGTRVLTDSVEATSLDWGSRRGYDNSGSIVTLDWGGLVLNDSAGIPAVDWRNRYLIDQGAVTRIEWDSPSFISQINHYAYSTNKIDLSAETEALTNYPSYGNTFTPAGEIINNASIDVGVSDYDLVSLDSTGTWVQTAMTTQGAFKMLGIAFNVGSTNSVLLEGHMVVSSGSNGAPKISDLTIGKAVYMNTTSSGVFMSNTAPVVTGQTVRLLGHVYYNSTNDATWYTMKFRPSHDWVTL